jgi:hypothetical protein
MTLSGNLLNTNPQLIGPPGDFRLQSTSPAINAGEAISSVAYDWDGNSRPVGGAWDIGAFEYR